MEKFKKMMEEAKENSKQNFIKFLKDFYDVDTSMFNHIWDAPVLASYEDDLIISTTLSTKSKEEILKILDKFVKNELGKSKACFVYFDKLKSEFSDEEIEEYINKLNKGEISEDYNCAIFYNEKKLERKYRALIKVNTKIKNPKTQEEVDRIFTDILTNVITHERCHLNANTLQINGSESQQIMNIAEMENKEFDDRVMKRSKSKAELRTYSNRNEVLIDTLAQIIDNYKEGDSIEECLYRIIKDRKGVSGYKDFDDTDVLSIYALFPEEITEWATFGAYDFVRINKLRDKIVEIYGSDDPLSVLETKEKLSQYYNLIEDGKLSEKQKQMIKMLVEKRPEELNEKQNEEIDKKQIKEVAMSKEGLGSFAGSLLDVAAVINRAKNERKNEREK